MAPSQDEPGPTGTGPTGTGPSGDGALKPAPLKPAPLEPAAQSNGGPVPRREATGPTAPVAGAGAFDGEGGRMTLAEHLTELRRRVLICAVALTVASIAGWFVYNPVLHFLTIPYRSYYIHHKGMITSALVVTSPVEGFTTRLKVSMYIGIALAAPVWLLQVWRFITPGLKKKERQYALPFVLSALVLFTMGVVVAVLVWPKALNWLISVSGTGVEPLFSPSGYVNLYLLVCLVFGLVFLYPTIVVGLMIAGVVPSAKWRKWRRPAIVVLCAVAAIVTPSNDPFTFLGMAVPMLIFYECSIIVGRLLGK